MSEPTPSHIDLRSVAQRTSQRGSRILSGFLFFTLLFLGVVFVWLPYVLNEPPQDFPTGKLIVIDEGLTQDAVTKLLQEENVVRSSLYLYILLRTQYADAYVQAGTYQFDTRKTTEEIAYAVMTGEESAPLLRFTLPEGFHARDLGMYLPKELDIETGADIQTLEGTLFPDTYFIRRDTTLIDIVTLLQSTMEEKIAPLRGAIEASGFTEDEVIILASILEREANDEISKKMVSGILQNRLRIGMALQVDATFHYLLGKTSAELTIEDLEMDSPYNTYEYPGLPPGPIANPGLEAIMAVLEPTESDYFYYLTGNDGMFYYAETFEEHKRNKERYLRP